MGFSRLHEVFVYVLILLTKTSYILELIKSPKNKGVCALNKCCCQTNHWIRMGRIFLFNFYPSFPQAGSGHVTTSVKNSKNYIVTVTKNN